MFKNSAIYISSFLITFILFLHPIIDFFQDLGRHIKLGEIIWHQAQSCSWLCNPVPTTNLFSYTYPNFPFINSHWLSEVIFYMLYNFLGAQGLLLSMTFLVSIGMLLLFRYAMSKATIFPVFLSFCLYGTILLSRIRIRPELFSYFLVAVFIFILYKNRDSTLPHPNPLPKGEGKQGKNNLWLFLLPLMEILWVNLHIYFPVGIALVGIFLIDLVLGSQSSVLRNWLAGYRSSSRTNRKLIDSHPKTENRGLRTLFIVFLLTCLATLINPNGLTGALYPLHIFSNYGYPIEENQSIFFLINYYGGGYLWYWTFFISAFLLGIFLLTNRKVSKVADWLLFIVFFAAAYMAERNLALFVFATFVPFAIYASKTYQKFGLENLPKVILYQKIISVIAASALVYISIHSLGFGIQTTPTIEKGADFFIHNHIQGPLFNNFDIGSYLDYRFYPQTKVFVDGRPEAYPVDFFQNTYIPMQQDPKVFEKVEQKYHFQSIFFSYTDQTPWAIKFIPSIMQNPKWQLVYLDSYSVIWVKKDGLNKDIAINHPITHDTFVLPQDPNFTVKDYYRIMYILEFFGWHDNVLAVLRQILNIDPGNCAALRMLAQNPSTQTIYAFRYQNYCH